jgi:hypothetical protein
MTNLAHNIVTPTNAIEADIAEKRNAVGDSIKREYGAVKVYAVALFGVLPEGWYDIEHTDVSEEAKSTLAEATKFRDVLRKAGHKNPSVIWTRVRKEARIHIEGAPEKEEGASNLRSLQRRFIEDIPALFRAGKREKNGLTTQQQQVMTHLASAITALGLDLSQIVK